MSTSSQFVPVLKSELDFFKPRAVQTTQIGYETIALKPINSVGETTKRIEFFHPGKNTDFYRKISHTYFYFKFAVTKADGTTKIDETKLYSYINYLGQTLINSVEVQLNGVTVTRNTENYPYRGFIETLLGNTKLETDCHLASSGFSVDTGNKVDEITAANTAMIARRELIKDKKEVEYISRLHGDLFNTHLYLPNGLDLTVNLNLNRDEFILMSGEADPECSFRLKDVTLYTEICHINPAVLAAHAKTFQDHNAIIPMQHVEVQSVTIAPGSRVVAIDNIFTGRLPSVIIIGMTPNSAYAGSFKWNPLCFKHLDLTYMTVSINGVQHRLGPLNFNNNLHVMGYHQMLKATGLLDQSDAPLISLDRYLHGYALFAYDFSAEGEGAGAGTHSSLQPVGNVRIEASFNTALSEAITFIVYSVREGAAIEIDKNRSVYVTL